MQLLYSAESVSGLSVMTRSPCATVTGFGEAFIPFFILYRAGREPLVLQQGRQLPRPACCAGQHAAAASAVQSAALHCVGILSRHTASLPHAALVSQQGLCICRSRLRVNGPGLGAGEGAAGGRKLHSAPQLCRLARGGGAGS